MVVGRRLRTQQDYHDRLHHNCRQAARSLRTDDRRGGRYAHHSAGRYALLPRRSGHRREGTTRMQGHSRTARNAARRPTRLYVRLSALRPHERTVERRTLHGEVVRQPDGVHRLAQCVQRRACRLVGRGSADAHHSQFDHTQLSGTRAVCRKFEGDGRELAAYECAQQLPRRGRRRRAGEQLHAGTVLSVRLKPRQCAQLLCAKAPAAAVCLSQHAHHGLQRRRDDGRKAREGRCERGCRRA